jgi:hypothetical protein
MRYKNIELIIISSLILGLGSLSAQQDYTDRSSLGGAIVYGFYSPSSKIENAYLQYMFSRGQLNEYPTTYGGAGGNLRLLFKTDYLSSRLKLGGQIGIQTYRFEDLPEGIIIFVGEGGPTATDRITNGFDAQFLADYLLTSLESIDLHAEVGLGLVAFWGVLHDIPFSPSTEFVASLKFIPSVRISSSMTVDPQVGILKGFSSNDILLLSVELGLSYWW